MPPSVHALYKISNRRHRNPLPVKKVLFHFLGISMSLLFGLSAAEVIIRVQGEKGFRGAWNAFIEGDVPISYAGDDEQLVADPVLGFRYNPKFPNTNSLGLRHPEIERTKPPGRPRVIVLGDSVSAFSDGGPNSDDLYVRVLQRDWEENAEVINAAITGYTIYQQRLLLETVLIDFQPDLVVVQYTLNDNARFMHRWHVDPSEGQGLQLTEFGRRSLLAGTADPLSWLPDASYTATRLRLALAAPEISRAKYPWRRAPGFTLAWQQESWALVEEQLDAMKKLVERVGGELVVVMVPFGPQLNADLLAADRDYVLKPQRIMGQVCDRLGVTLLDLFEDFHKVDGERFFYDMIHMTKDGHQIVVRALNRHFERLFAQEKEHAALSQ